MFISMKSFKASNFVLLMAFILSSQLFVSAEEKFSISKDRKSAKAIVGENKEFTVTFDPPLASKIEEYESGKPFYLIVSSCKMRIKPAKKELDEQTDIVSFDITDSIGTKLVTVNDPAGFKVTSDEVKFDGVDPNCKDGVKFEPYPADATKFLVEVSLDGNFPDSLALKSEDATLYVNSTEASNKEASDKETNSGEILPIWAWILIGVGVFIFLVFVIIAITVSICVKRRKQKTFHQIDPTLHTAIEKAKSNDHTPTVARAKDGKRNIFEKSEKTNNVTQTEEQVVVKPDSVPQVHNQALVQDVPQVHNQPLVQDVPQVHNQALVQESKTPQTQEPNVIKNPSEKPANFDLSAFPPIILKNPLTSKKKKSSKKKRSKAVKASESGPQAKENGPQSNENVPQANDPQANGNAPQANDPQANGNAPQANGNGFIDNADGTSN